VSGKTKAQLVEEIRERDARIDVLLRMQAADHDTMGMLLDEIDRLEQVGKYSEAARKTDLKERQAGLDKYFSLVKQYLEAAENIRSEIARHAANAKRKLTHDDAVRLVDEKLANNPRLSKSEAFRRVAEEQKLEKGRDSWSAVRYAYTHPD
jgi:hypothetical protein